MQYFVGLDWPRTSTRCAWSTSAAKVVAQFTVEHTAVGMTELGLSKAAGLTVAVKRLAWISTAGRSPNAWRIR